MRSPYAKRCTGAKRERKRVRDRERREEQAAGRWAIRILAAALRPYLKELSK